MINTFILAGLAGLVVAGVIFLLLRKIIYSVLDPVLVGFSTIVMSAVMVYGLYDLNGIQPIVLLNFVLLLLAFLLGAKASCKGFSIDGFRNALEEVSQRFSRNEVIWVFVVTLVLTLVLSILGFIQGAAGDARLEFFRNYRALVLIQSGMSVPLAILLLTREISFRVRASMMLLLVLLSVPFSGKSVFLPLLQWVGLWMFLEQRKISIGLAVPLGLSIVGVFSLVVVFAYGATSVSDVVYILIGRVLASGDVYIYAYQSGSMDAVKQYYHPDFLAYMLHPLTSIIGFRGYEKPLGSMLASEMVGMDILTGPNPQVPVLLDFFFAQEWSLKLLLAYLLGFLSFYLRGMSVISGRSFSRYSQLGLLTAGIFLPTSGFADFSYTMGKGIGVVVGVLMLVVYVGIVRFLLLSHESEWEMSSDVTESGEARL